MMRVIGCVLFIALLGAANAHAQSYFLNGYVEDTSTGERLPGANLYDELRNIGTATNAYGFYSLTLPADSVTLWISYIGYRDTTLTLSLAQDTWLTIQLTAEPVGLGMIRITADANIDRDISAITLSARQIEQLPAILGEPDALKALQLMPGVQSGTEGTSGLHVRGGSPDQNLILVDGAPVYNVSHLFGFFSVFNTDAIQSVKLVKGGFPARYGGRLSSVVDITMREGNTQRFSGRGSIGLLASRFTLEGPLVKDKSSFIISGRRTYIDLLTRPAYRIISPEASVGYYFYDLNAKANYIRSDQERVFVSIYKGNDRFYSRATESFTDTEESQNAGLGWQNLTATARWTRVLRPSLFAGLTLVHSRYRFSTSIFEEENIIGDDQPPDESSISYASDLRDWGLRFDVDYAPAGPHTIQSGLRLTHHTYRPEVVQQQNTGGEKGTEGVANEHKLRGVEWAAYIEDRVHLGPATSVRLGLRVAGTRIDSRTFSSLEPRVSVRRTVAKQWQLSASFTQMRQFIHLLSNGGAELPTDLWVPATNRIPPQLGRQVGMSISRPLGGETYLFQFEGYYKWMNQVIAYKDGASFIETGQDWQDKVEIGRGRAYGGELFLEKRRGRATGWLAYTLSWATRTFNDINQGNAFPYRYDRRHDVALVYNLQLTPRRQFSVSWVYKTGTPVTLPIGQVRFSADPVHNVPGGTFDYYAGRNSVRMRSFHRLDLAYRIRYDTRWGESELGFSIYNVYSRLNPFYMELGVAEDLDPNTGERRLRAVYKETGLVPILPSLSYRFKF